MFILREELDFFLTPGHRRVQNLSFFCFLFVGHHLHTSDHLASLNFFSQTFSMRQHWDNYGLKWGESFFRAESYPFSHNQGWVENYHLAWKETPLGGTNFSIELWLWEKEEPKNNIQKWSFNSGTLRTVWTRWCPQKSPGCHVVRWWRWGSI